MIPPSLGSAALQQALDGIVGYLGGNSLTTSLIAGLLGYAILCSSLRLRRVKRLRRDFGFPDRESLSRMTNAEARSIFEITTLYDFPLFFDLGLRLALFRTYANDNVGELLYSSSDLIKPSECSKRYDDTSAMYVCFFKFAPGSQTLSEAIGRVNFLHRPYIKSGKIQNKDLLYVLYASLYEPIRFLSNYDWRELSDIEVAAMATVWKYIGEMMDIDYKAELGKDEWKDGIDFLQDVKAWGALYEDEHMKPSPQLAKVGEVTIELLLSSYPGFARPLGYSALKVLVGERLRHVFGLPEPGVTEMAFVYSALFIRKLTVRYLCLPRIWPRHLVDSPDPQTGRIKSYRYLKDPWYVPVTFWTRWGPEALLQRAFGLSVPGDGGPEMKPDGYLFTDIGPRGKLGKGLEETAQLAAIAHAKASPACPFAPKVME